MESADSDLTDADVPPADPAGEPPARAARNGDRQARVGILRNPNAPPRPPPRRASLTGRWPLLRSKRRPPGCRGKGADLVDPAPLADNDESGQSIARAVRRAENGRVQSIDIDSLMASVAGIGRDGPTRTPYSAIALGTEDADDPSADPRKPAVLTAAAWIEDEDGDEDDDPLGDAFSQALSDGSPWPEQEGDGDATDGPQSPDARAGRRRWSGLLVWLAGLLVAVGAVYFLTL